MSGIQATPRPVKAYLIGAWAAAIFLSLAALAFWGGSAYRAVEWRTVVAEVIATETRRPNSKDPPEIFATVRFELDGVSHEAEEGVFNSRAPSELEAALKDWPTGKRFDLFVDPENPQAVEWSREK